MRGADTTTTGRARLLRRSQTEAERRLWARLRNRGLAGHKFTRQEPIGPYIADFCCREHGLVVELDGSQHVDSARDATRDAFLATEGYRVLRFWNPEIFTNMSGVIETILAALSAERPPHPRADALASAPGKGGFGPLPARGER
ncbi:MAG TPA: endonuclease domain-containing protein [Salinarimonas sp.]|nr:endonuclease domain-containing protein [Salinarimonas sp.]